MIIAVSVLIPLSGRICNPTPPKALLEFAIRKREKEIDIKNRITELKKVVKIWMLKRFEYAHQNKKIKGYRVCQEGKDGKLF